eukprot:jgi/Orpsp1_1/1178803/evm.model.c7180000066800.1
MNITSSTGKNFILTFVDDYSRKSWIFLLEKKKEVPKTTIQFLKTITNRFDCNIKYFRTDNGLEFKNKKIENFCLNHGITKLYSPPYNPQNNGKVERFNQTLVQCAKTLLSWSRLDIKFWDYAINYANYLYNLNPHKGIGNAIPNEVFFNKKVDLKYIKTFGCIAHYKDFSQNKGKFDENGKKGIYLGFNFKNNCYIIMDYMDLKIHLVREAIFDEEQPSNFIISNSEQSLKAPTNNLFYNDTDNDDNFTLPSNNDIINEKDHNHNTLNDHNSTSDDEISIMSGIEHNISNNDTQIMNNDSTTNDINTDDNNNHINENQSIDPTAKYTIDDIIDMLNTFKVSPENNYEFTHKINVYPINGKRRHSFDSIYYNKKKKINHGYLNSINKRKHETENNKDNQKRARVNEIINNLPVKRTGNLIDSYNSKRPRTSEQHGEISSITLDTPLNFHDAITSIHKDKWLDAINNELGNLYENNIMTFVKELPLGKKAIKTKWVFTIKRD